MEGQGHQELVALNVQLGPSKLLFEMLPVLLVQLVKALQLHSQHVQLVHLISTVQIQGIHVLLVLQPVKQQIQLLDRLNVVRVICFLETTFYIFIFFVSGLKET